MALFECVVGQSDYSIHIKLIRKINLQFKSQKAILKPSYSDGLLFFM